MRLRERSQVAALALALAAVAACRPEAAPAQGRSAAGGEKEPEGDDDMAEMREQGSGAGGRSREGGGEPQVGAEAGHQRAPLPSPEEIAKLPPDGGPEFNRLIFEKSPYLLQHARNPVDWHSWGEEAFERARVEDKPVFLSIGYSTCHWCHVMERESFEDAEVGRLLGEWFVSIKVDREERPDLDHVYMQITQAMTGSGGWPMTVVLTPGGKPFFAGTYFPRESRGGRIGMLDLLPRLHEAWTSRREGVLADAERATEWLRQNTAGAPGDLPGREVLRRAFGELAQTYDPVHGGFGSEPKFPVPHDLLFLLQYAQRSGDGRALEMAAHTLREMRLGGIYDHVGYGFHRYSTDPEWLLPHFEKMLYDQALLAMAYVAGWQATGGEDLRATAEEVLAYVLRDMTSPEGGFYSAEDADSEGEEGLFYVWAPEELAGVLGEQEAKLAIRTFNVEPGGNFRDQATGQRTGRSILHLAKPLDELGTQLGLEPKELRRRVESARAKLFEARERREHPLKDDKVLTDWNGLMIAAMARASRAFGEPRYAGAAARAADFVLAELRDGRGRLQKRWRGGEAGLPGTLEDYSFFTWGLLELYETTFDVRWLRAAIETTDLMVAHFHDAGAGGFFLTADDAPGLIVRGKEVYDGALPSGNSVAAWNLLRLSRTTARSEYEDLALGTLKAFAGQVARRPSSHAVLLMAVDFLEGPSYEIVVAGDPAAEDTRRMLAALQRRFLPGKVLLLRPPGESPPIARIAEYTAAQVPRDGRATAYVCQDFACKEPVTDAEAMLASVEVAWE